MRIHLEEWIFFVVMYVVDFACHVQRARLGTQFVYVIAEALRVGVVAMVATWTRRAVNAGGRDSIAVRRKERPTNPLGQANERKRAKKVAAGASSPCANHV
jgi:hypothetical protein